MNIGGTGCSSAVFKLNGIQYTNVCGKVIGYQQGAPDAFGTYFGNRGLTIDDHYMDGVSLTHGCIIQGNTSGHLQLLFMRSPDSPLPIVSTSVPALTSTIQPPSPFHLMCLC